MHNAQEVGMKGLTVKGRERIACRREEKLGLGLEAGGVNGVADERVADMGEMNADLMGPPRLELARDEAGNRHLIGAIVAFDRFPSSERRAAAGAYRHLVAGARVAVDRGIDLAFVPVWRAPHEGQIAPPERSGAAVVG